MSSPWQLNSDEMALVQNAQWLLTKQQVIDKVYELLGQLSIAYSRLLVQYPLYDTAVHLPSPKIARGEYYRQLPYVILDQPRYFTGENALAIRSFFWWGNSFSIHLHLSGTPLKACLPVLLQHLANGKLQQWHTVLTEDRWQHYFGPGNYVDINSISAADIASRWQQQPFLKLAKTLPLHQWDTAYHFYLQAFEELLVLLSTEKK